MSNYQAISRAIKAENAARRCEEIVSRCEAMVYAMRHMCRDHERQQYQKAKEEFDQRHKAAKAQLEALINSHATAVKCTYDLPEGLNVAQLINSHATVEKCTPPYFPIKKL